jgi:hypothetical protein
MAATYVVGGVMLGVSFATHPNNAEAAAYWASAGCVGGVGLLSFVRHSVFHRSDAARMGWDYGRRNDFQIEVGIANLSWGAVGILAWALAWGAAAAGAITLSFGVYMLGASLLHLGDIRGGTDRRPGPAVASLAFAIALLVAGFGGVTA